MRCPGRLARLKSVRGWALAGIILAVIVLIFFVALIVVVNVPAFRAWLGEKMVEADVNIAGLSLKGISLTSAMVEVTVCTENTNPLGVTLDRIAYDIYFDEGGKWVKLGDADRGEDVMIKGNDSTCFDIVNEIKIFSSIRAFYEAYNQHGSVNLKVTGSARLKVWPVSVEVPFERVQKVGL